MADDHLADLSARARRLAEELLQELQGGEARAQGVGITEHIEVWVFNLLREGRSPRTVSAYKGYVLDLLRNSPFPNRQDIERWLGQKRAAGCSSTYINVCLSAVKSLFTSAIDAGILSINPTDRIRRSTVPHRERPIPAASDLATLLRSPLLRVKDAAMILLMLDSGLRVAELCSMRVIDLHIAHLQATIIGKGNKQRTILFGETTAQLIQTYLAVRGTKSPYLFPNRMGKPCDEHIVQQRMHWLCEKIGIPPITPHQLRHFFASAMLEDGADVKVVSELLGHAKVSTTLDIYNHIMRADAKRVEHNKHNPLKRLKGE